MKDPGQPAARPLLPTAVLPLAVAIVVVCVLVMAVQGVWIRHGMETGWLDTAVDANVKASLGGHPLLLAVLVWPGAPIPVAAMAAALVLVCILRHRYCEAALVAVTVPLATAITELVLKPLIGGTSWGNPFPQRTRHQRGCLSYGPNSATRQKTREDAAPTVSCPWLCGLPGQQPLSPLG